MSTPTGELQQEAAALPEGSSGTFSFTPLEKPFASLSSDSAVQALRKWNLEPYMQAKQFRFNQAFSPDSIDAFLLDFFASPVVQETAPVCVGTASGPFAQAGQFSTLGAVAPGAVKHMRLPTTVLRLDFFDRLKDAEIVRAGDIAKCLDEQCGEILVSDKLRKLLLDEASEEWELFSELERSELIFRIMKALAVGGGLNQYEDQMEPYLNMTKALYKDLVSVHKTAAGTLAIGSLTYAISEVNGSSASLFPRPSPNNFCYVTIDPAARHVKLFYAAYVPMM